MTNIYDNDFNTDNISLGLPTGLYKVMITGEEKKESQNPNNPYRLVLTFEVVEGVQKGRKHSQGYNLWHSNPATRNIANQEIKRIAQATGVAITPTAPAKGRVLQIELRQQKNSDFLEVGKYYPKDYSAPVISDDIPL